MTRKPEFGLKSGCMKLIAINGVAFTGEGKLVRKATGYEQEKLKPRYPTSGSGPREPSFRRAPIGAYRSPTDFSDAAKEQVRDARCPCKTNELI
jgi:hypothetical protein